MQATAERGDGRWLPAKLRFWTQTQKQVYRIHIKYDHVKFKMHRDSTSNDSAAEW